MSSDWCTIESDPGVFTSLIESFGVKNAQLTELWSMDDDSLFNLKEEYGHVHGLIFLFKWQSNQNSSNKNDKDDGEVTGKPLASQDIPENLFFARQVVTNACATQAILSVLFNASTTLSTTEGSNNDKQEKAESSNGESNLILGPMLSDLKSFSMSFPPDLKGEVIGASDEIRKAHNSFSRKEAFLIDNSQKRMATDDDDVFHFIAYVPHNNNQQVYELDGLQPGPILSGNVDVTNNDHGLGWLQVARSAIQKRIEKYSATEIKFNLMALTADKRVEIQSKINTLLESGLSESDGTIAQLKADLVNEEETRQCWQEENERRRHNYLPLCVELIRAIAGTGKLPEYTNKANEKVKERRKNMQSRKMNS